MPITFQGPVDIVEDLVEVYRGAVPPDIANASRRLDEAYTAAEIMSYAEGQISSWIHDSRISTARGIWLDHLAKDRGVYRQDGETDDQLRVRLRRGPRAVIYEAVLEAIQAVLDAAGNGFIAYLIRVPVDQGAFVTTDCWCDVDSRVTPTRPRHLVALIPALANSRPAVLDALRAKVTAGTLYHVEEY